MKAINVDLIYMYLTESAALPDRYYKMGQNC